MRWLVEMKTRLREGSMLERYMRYFRLTMKCIASSLDPYRLFERGSLLEMLLKLLIDNLHDSIDVFCRLSAQDSLHFRFFDTEEAQRHKPFDLILVLIKKMTRIAFDHG